MYRIGAIVVLALIALIEFVLLLDQWRDGDVDAAVGAVQQEQCVSANAGADLALTELQLGLHQCQTQWTEAQGRASIANSMAASADAAAQAAFAKWTETYRNQPPTCTAARLALDEACATLKDY